MIVIFCVIRYVQTPECDLRSRLSESRKYDSSLDAGALFPFFRESKCNFNWRKFANFLMLALTLKWFFFISGAFTPPSMPHSSCIPATLPFLFSEAVAIMGPRRRSSIPLLASETYNCYYHSWCHYPRVHARSWLALWDA